MKKTAVFFILMVMAAAAAFANGNAEKLTSLQGTVVQVGEQVTLRTENGDEVILDIPAQERDRLRLEVGTRLMVKGVFVGVPAGQKLQAKILARTVTANGAGYTVKDPVGLTEQDRLRIRDCEAEQLKTRTQTQTQTQDRTMDQTRTQSQSADGSGSGSQKGK